MQNTTIILLLLFFTGTAHAEKSAVWIGMSTPTNGQREGIYRSAIDLENGTLERPALAAEIGMPEFLALHPNGKRLYAAVRLANGDGGVAAYEISDDTHSLRFLNSQPTGGG